MSEQAHAKQPAPIDADYLKDELRNSNSDHLVQKERDLFRIFEIKGVTVVFLEAFDTQEVCYEINAMVEADDAIVTIKMISDKPFTQRHFDLFATESSAQAVINQARYLGFTPVTKPNFTLDDEPC